MNKRKLRIAPPPNAEDVKSRSRHNELIANHIQTFHFSQCKCFAFTLAEVLITLGIIGVVAALTLPVLIENHKKTVWVNQLKKSVTVVENGFKSAMAKDGVDNFYETELWQKLKEYQHLSQDFIDEFKKYFTVIGPCLSGYTGFECDFYYRSKARKSPLKQLNGKPIQIYYSGTDDAIILKDGSMLGIPIDPSFKLISIDVNGTKGPNQLGRDIFIFNITETGNLKAQKSNYETLEEFVETRVSSIPEQFRESAKQSISNQYYNSYVPLQCHCEPAATMVEAKTRNCCAYRVISEGWKMNY